MYKMIVYSFFFVLFYGTINYGSTSKDHQTHRLVAQSGPIDNRTGLVVPSLELQVELEKTKSVSSLTENKKCISWVNYASMSQALQSPRLIAQSGSIDRRDLVVPFLTENNPGISGAISTVYTEQLADDSFNPFGYNQEVTRTVSQVWEKIERFENSFRKHLYLELKGKPLKDLDALKSYLKANLDQESEIVQIKIDDRILRGSKEHLKTYYDVLGVYIFCRKIIGN